MTNSIGIFFGGKKFKPVDPFGKKEVHEVVTLESKSETFEYLQNKFERR